MITGKSQTKALMYWPRYPSVSISRPIVRLGLRFPCNDCTDEVNSGATCARGKPGIPKGKCKPIDTRNLVNWSFLCSLLISFPEGFATEFKSNMHASFSRVQEMFWDSLTHFQELQPRWVWVFFTLLSRLSFVVKSGVIISCHDVSWRIDVSGLEFNISLHKLKWFSGCKWKEKVFNSEYPLLVTAGELK